MKTIDTICVIDDDLIYHYTIRKEIEFTKVAERAIFFANGETAIQFFNQIVYDNTPATIPDIILLDLNMPVMDGWEFISHFAQLKPLLGKKVVIYIVSSSVDSRDYKRAKEISQVSDYIVKPITGRQLIHMARDYYEDN